MTPDDAGFAELIRRAAVGDDAARGELFTRYHRAVRFAVRKRMPDRLRTQFDSLDFAQDVWASFLALPPDRVAFADPDALGGFLVKVAEFKLRDALIKRDSAAAREEYYAPVADPDRRVHTPSQYAIAAERWEVLMADLPPGHRVILEQLRDGKTHREIAEGLNLSLRAIERIVRRLKDICEKDG